MDGLLIDTEAVYLAAYQAAAALMGVELPLAFCHSLIGRPSPDCDRMIREFSARPSNSTSSTIMPTGMLPAPSKPGGR